MKRRVALISSSAPPQAGGPTTGGGLRTAQLAGTLRAAGHTVRMFIERAALTDSAPVELLDNAFEREGLAEQVKAFRPSVLVVEQWALVPLVAPLGKPLVVDLHGSLLLENLYRRGELELTLDAGSKIEALACADLLLVPTQAQVHHFSAWATLAGFDPREVPIALMPLALEGEAIVRSARRPPLRLVYGGARWPWIDSLEPLSWVAEAVAELPAASLDVFTYSPPTHGLSCLEGQGTWPELLELLAHREQHDIRLHEGADHCSWQVFLREQATVALDLWQPNAERMLALTTRSAEFLWAGLGLITVRGSAWSEALHRSGAGWTLAADDREGLKTLLHQLAEQPSQIARASRAASALVGDEYQLQAAGSALLEFCQQPSHPHRSPRSLPRELVALREDQLSEELQSLQRAHRDEHECLVAAHRQERQEDRQHHQQELERLRQHHKELSKQARQEARQELKLAAGEHRKELKRRDERANQELQAAVQSHRKEVEALTLQHREQLGQLAAEQREELSGLKAERQAENQRIVAQAKADLKLAEQGSRAQLQQLTRERSAQLKEARSEARKELKSAAKEHRQALKKVDSEAKAELQKAVEAHRAEVLLLTGRHRTEVEELAAERQDEVQKLVAQNQAELERADERHRAELKALAAERQDEVQKLVGQSQAELAQADERHRAELKARVEEMQQQQAALQQTIEELRGRAATERRRIKEDRARLEVDLRAEMSQREAELRAELTQQEAELRTSLNEREAELGVLLQQANLSLAARLRERIGALGPAKGSSGRLAPTLRLARLWAEHAADHHREGQED